MASPAQKARWLAPQVQGRTRSCFAMTEPAPGAGADPGMLQTTAVRDGAGYRINGRKWFITGADGLEPAMDDFIALHRFSRADKHTFMTEEMQAYFRALAEALAALGWLQLSFLDVGGRPVATYFCFDYNNEILVYNSGYDPAGVPQLSPGWVLLARLIRHAIGLGRSRFDFLQGNEDYKYRFGGTDMPIYRTLLRPAKRS